MINHVRDIIAEISTTQETGSYTADCLTGRAIAGDILAIMRETGTPLALVHVARSIAESGRFGGIEVGLYTAIAEHAAAA